MSFPNYPEFAEVFAAKLDRLYIADGYSEETNINNMIVQLLILEGYISSDDLAQGSVIEKSTAKRSLRRSTPSYNT